MSRSRAYDPDTLLDRAVQVFWEQGFRATSLEDLVAATGVHRSSLYAAHADKEGLFLACLDRYHATIFTDWLEPLERPGAGLPELRKFFAAAVAWTLDGDGPGGCLTCNTAMEIGGATPAIAARIESYVGRMTAAFRRAIDVAKKQGALPADAESEAKADHLMGVLFGFFVFAKTPAPREAVERYLAEALRDLGWVRERSTEVRHS